MNRKKAYAIYQEMLKQKNNSYEKSRGHRMKKSLNWVAIPQPAYFGLIAAIILLLAISIFGIILYRKKERKHKKICCYGVFVVSLFFLLLISRGIITAEPICKSNIQIENLSEVTVASIDTTDKNTNLSDSLQGRDKR